MATAPSTVWSEGDGQVRLAVAGEWTTAALDQSGWTQATPANIAGQVVRVDLGGIAALDSNGALVLTKWLYVIERQAEAVELHDPP